MQLVGDCLELSATDMDLEITETLTVTNHVGNDFAAAINATSIYEMIRKLPDGVMVSFALDQKIAGKINIKSGAIKFSLSYLSAEEFPVMIALDLTHDFILPAQQVKSLIDKTYFAISSEETRYNLGGIYLHSYGEFIRSVATDGHRLSYVDHLLPSGAADMPSVILPRKAAQEIKKLLDEYHGDVDISLSSTKIVLKCNNITLISKLIDGVFPDYEVLIPQENDKVLTVATDAFEQAVDRISSVTFLDKFRSIKLNLKSGQLLLSASGEGNGFGLEELEVLYEAEDLEVSFNARYVLDVMSVMKNSEALLIFKDHESPVIIRDAADDTASYVIMPMR
jgi:DNA polymerase-3 subunit beta